jgi:hypothetical protein
VTTLLYLPRLLQLYLRPIECPISAFFAVLALPLGVALAIFGGHKLLLSAISVGLWAETGIAVVETLIGYGVVVWFKRRWLRQSVDDIRKLFDQREDIVAAAPKIAEAPPATAGDKLS